MMNEHVLDQEELLRLTYRLAIALRRSAVAGGDAYNVQLREELDNPKPTDWVVMINKPELPIAFKIGKLIATSPIQDSEQCRHTIMLLDGSVTTWRGVKLMKLPKGVFAMTTTS